MMLLLSLALAYDNQPHIVSADGDLRVCIASCVHLGQDALGGRDSLTVTLDGFEAAGCDVGALIGDTFGSLGFAGRGPNGGAINAPLAEYGAAGVMPRDEEYVEFLRQLDAHTWGGTLYVIEGNHGANSAKTALYHDNTANPGFKGVAPGTSLDAFIVRTEVECAAGDERVDWLMLGDTNRSQDIGVCGQLDTMGGQELRKSGAPAASYTAGQLEFLRSRLKRSAEIGRDLAVLAHVPPPETTFGTWEGEGREPLTGIGQPLHGPTWVDYWTDLDRPSLFWPGPSGLTQPETCDAWSGTSAIQANGAADPAWLRRMLGDMEAYSGDPHPLVLWVGGHSHMPSPAWVQNGRGMWAEVHPDGGGAPVPVIQAGAITRHHSGHGTSQFVVAHIGCGSRHVERWVVEAPWCSPSACGAFWRPVSYPGKALTPDVVF